ncbi:CHASE2 domain-containing protein [Pantanalinema sp. GBBB05]|uniref:CHASE2 domain-containing protein n=1 Tax=Pantanalinema sp. GBBB05 TaxID=2604139 RepID=UPI001DAB1E02|nr:CHASE2 domain-containing protein [Pantanalinema sp. GBBB05]
MVLAESMVTMVFTDLVGSTAVKRHLAGDDVSERNQRYFDTILQPHRLRMEADLAHYGGRVVKTEGDAYFLVFTNAVKAARWAVTVQKSHLQDPIPTPLGALQVKIGMHTGSPLLDGDDFIGHEVDYAARVAAVAMGGEILLSEVTAVLVRSAHVTGFAILPRGNRELKGIGEVPIFELVYGGKSVKGPTILSDSPVLADSISTTAKGAQEATTALVETPTPLPQQFSARQGLRSLSKVLLCSVVVSIAVIVVRSLGGLQFIELKAFDALMQLRPTEGKDDRILIVAFTEADVQALQQPAIADHTLVKLLTALEKHQPAVIGLDLYRDIPIGQGQQELLTYLQQSDRLIAACKVADDTDKVGIAPPPGLTDGVASQDHHLGFSNVLLDADNSVRRHYLQLNPPVAARCATHYALSLQVAFHYLQTLHGIQGQFLNDSHLQLGQVTFNRLNAPMGGYQRVDDQGFQILLNYRSPLQVAEQVTVSDVLAGRVQPQAIKNKIIFIGVDREDFDRILTPYGKEITGVSIQAQGTSQIVSAVLDGRSVLTVWSFWMEAGWILVWSLSGGLIAWHWRSTRLPGITVAIIILAGFCFGFLVKGVWIPLVPPALAMVITAGSISYNFLGLKQVRDNH